MKRREGQRQCDISPRSLSLIILSVSWLHAFLLSPLPQTFVELFEIAELSEERATDAVTAHLEELVRFEGASEAMLATDLYTSMVSTFREMSSDSFAETLWNIYHPDDESDNSDPSMLGSRWSIPGPGEDFPISIARRPSDQKSSGHYGLPSLATPVPVTPSQMQDTPSIPVSAKSGSTSTASVPVSESGSPTTPRTTSITPPVGHRVAPTPSPGLVVGGGTPHPAPSTGSSGEESPSTTFTVLRIKHDPYRGEHRYVIWAGQVASSKRSGVKAVKFTRHLHVAKNHVRQAHVGSGGITVRLPPDLTLYDPQGITSTSEAKNLQVVRTSSLTYSGWLESLESKGQRWARVRPPPPNHSEDDQEPEVEGLPSVDNQEAKSELSGSEEAGEQLPPQEITMAPYRLEALKGKKRSPSQAEKPVFQLLKSTKRIGVLLDIWVGKELVPTSWMFDPSCEVSQISWAMAQTVWPSITPLGSARLRCTMATSSGVADLQLGRLFPVRLADFDCEDVKSEEFHLDVMINPSLKAHPCILGLNSIYLLQIKADFESQTVKCVGSDHEFPLRPRAGSVGPTHEPLRGPLVTESLGRAGPSVSDSGEIPKAMEGLNPGKSRMMTSGASTDTGRSKATRSASKKAKCTDVKAFTDQKRQQLTLRQSWSLKRFVARKKAEKYSSSDREQVKRAVERARSLEAEEDQLLHRMAMTSLSAVEFFFGRPN